MTVNSTLAHAAIKSLRHAQECINSIQVNDLSWWSADTFDEIILDLEDFVNDEMAVTEFRTSEEVERGE